MRGKLMLLRNKIQTYCYYWKVAGRSGACREYNSSGRLCTFCELVNEINEILNGGLQ